jgi:hypothetical protein
MTKAEAERRVEEIRKLAHDAEAAHAAEDELRRDFIAAVATGRCKMPAAVAKIVLSSGEIVFSRWYA